MLPGERPSGNLWKTLICVVVLANLPDVDVLLGLLLKSNGNVFHRGPTHSLLFALVSGFVASRCFKVLPGLPALRFPCAFFLVLSHLVADALLTSSPVSFFWPLEIHWSSGHSGWADVLSSVFLGSFKEGGIILACGAAVALIRVLKTYARVLKNAAGTARERH
jgi:membrane-bound metal-dependent hydrolase YbcI (DUF457 family)